MSEEKRFTNKKLIAVSIALILMCGTTGVLGFTLVGVLNDNTSLSGDYDDLYIDYLELSIDFNTLNDQYFILTGEHIELENDYNILVIALVDMTAEREILDSALADMTLERDNLVIDLGTMTLERDNLLTQVSVLNTEIDGHLNTISDLNTQIDLLEDEILVLEAQGVVDVDTIADLNAQIADLNTQISNYLNTISGLEATITANELEIADLSSQITTLIIERNDLIIDLGNMTTLRDGLQSELDDLQLLYDSLLGDYQILFDANVELQNTYEALLIAYDYICNTIKQTILPVQYSIFAEAVRRYYGDIYLDFHPLNPPKWYWAGFARFCRDIILHDSSQHDSFSVVSNAFSDALRYGNDTMYLADDIMCWTFYPWLPNWDGYDLTGNELTDMNTIVDWCIDEIDYEYDSDITTGQEYFNWDYIKFPVETMFRTMGDCEDQAILTATYLESCGFETAIAISHDPAHPTLGAFYHGHLLVHIEDTSAYYSVYSAPLWRLPNDPYVGFTWAWLDTTWDVPFGSTPSWLSDYGGSISSDVLTTAFCDIDGNIQENLGLTCVMPT